MNIETKVKIVSFVFGALAFGAIISFPFVYIGYLIAIYLTVFK